jgi:arsenite-transporting ATPase
VLVVSTDPAHSLGDALQVRLSTRPTNVRGVSGRLRGVEIDAPRAFRRWITRHARVLGDIVEQGTWLDRGDVDALLDLSIPGVDELMALLELVRLAHARPKNDLVIVDTAPTGHMLRLLSAPQLVAGAVDVLTLLQTDRRAIRERLVRASRPDEGDRFIELLDAQARLAAALMTDRTRSSFHWVMLAEELSLAESADAVAALREAGTPLAEVIVNRVIGGAAPCAICDRLRSAQRRVAARIPRVLGREVTVRIVLDQMREPRGIAALRRFFSFAGARSRRRSVRFARTMAFSSGGRSGTPPEKIAPLRDARLLLIGGKGGVGKTTIAAAVALRIARTNRSRRVLLMSTDPAHSLGDVFRARFCDTPRAVAGAPRNLRVREVDARAVAAVRRKDLEAAVAEISAAAGVTSGGLIDLAPPGIDELLGMVAVADSHAHFDSIVVDMAPTGHALRLLEIPAAAREWVGALLKLLLKYREVVPPGRLAAELVRLSKQIRRVQSLLRDPTRSRFVAVTRAATMPRVETERLLGRLRKLRIAMPVVIVNALTLRPRRCPRCRRIAASERRSVADLVRLCGRQRSCVIIQTPLAAPPPRGVAMLNRWAAEWEYLATR